VPLEFGNGTEAKTSYPQVGRRMVPPNPVARADWPPCLSGLGVSLHGRVSGNGDSFLPCWAGCDLEPLGLWRVPGGSNRRSGWVPWSSGVGLACGVMLPSWRAWRGRRPTKDQASASGPGLCGARRRARFYAARAGEAWRLSETQLVPWRHPAGATRSHKGLLTPAQTHSPDLGIEEPSANPDNGRLTESGRPRDPPIVDFATPQATAGDAQ